MTRSISFPPSIPPGATAGSENDSFDSPPSPVNTPWAHSEATTEAENEENRATSSPAATPITPTTHTTPTATTADNGPVYGYIPIGYTPSEPGTEPIVSERGWQSFTEVEYSESSSDPDNYDGYDPEMNRYMAQYFPGYGATITVRYTGLPDPDDDLDYRNTTMTRALRALATERENSTYEVVNKTENGTEEILFHLDDLIDQDYDADNESDDEDYDADDNADDDKDHPIERKYENIE